MTQNEVFSRGSRRFFIMSSLGIDLDLADLAVVIGHSHKVSSCRLWRRQIKILIPIRFETFLLYLLKDTTVLSGPFAPCTRV